MLILDWTVGLVNSTKTNKKLTKKELKKVDGLKNATDKPRICEGSPEVFSYLSILFHKLRPQLHNIT